MEVSPAGAGEQRAEPVVAVPRRDGLADAAVRQYGTDTAHPQRGRQPRAGNGQRDAAAVRRFTERFASVLVESGIPRMPARVFAALLGTDSGSLTAAELAGMLRVSPAAISSAVRYLAQVSLVTREREPGSRRDHYRLYDEVFEEIVSRRDQVLARWESGLRDGIEALGADTPAGKRIADTVTFFEFIRGELPAVLKRWREFKCSPPAPAAR